MKKTTILAGVVAGVAVALLALLGSGSGTASADNGPHVATGSDATPDKCAGCHRIHTGQNEYLLKAAGTVKDFCYSCHGTAGNGSMLAVQNGTYYGTDDRTAPDNTVGLRAGGFDAARINTTDPSNSTSPPSTIGVLASTQAVNSYHAIDGTTAGTMWGNGAQNTGAGPSYTLSCASCHDPHGNGNYRILRSVPEGSGGGGVTIADQADPKVYTTTNYFDMSQSGMTNILVDTSAWCAQCHTRYLAARRAPLPADASRVNSGDAIFTFRHTSAGWGNSSATPPVASNNTRACITCHATHGSNAQMTGEYSSTVPWPGGSLTNPTNDTQRASLLKMDNRGMCRKCHGSQ